AQEALNPEDEVDEFLSRAIDARSIDQLRKDHVKKFLLTFQTPELEKKVGVLLSPAVSALPTPPSPEVPSVLAPSAPLSPSSHLHPPGSSLSCFRGTRPPAPSPLGVTSVPSNLRGPLHPAGSMVPSFACSRVALRDCAARELNVTPEAVGPCQLRALNFSLGTPAGPCHHDGLACDFPEYFNYSVVLSLLACSVFLHISSIGKLLLMVAIEATYLVLVEGPQAALFDNADLLVVANALVGCIFGVPLGGCILGLGASLGFPWVGASLGFPWVGASLEFPWLGASLGWVHLWGSLGWATGEKEEMEELQAYNRRLLHNILPKDVAAHFLARERRNDELYYQSCECVAVMFASISNFSEFYVELEANNEGVECLRLLNEIIADFDEVPEGGA
ncbi:ADCY6 cyclase, partial [Chunga burmeisteri]|nr:ADCY6 cyclase [Chunga burmeisteri]